MDRPTGSISRLRFNHDRCFCLANDCFTLRMRFLVRSFTFEWIFSREVIEPAHVRRLKGVQEAWLEATEVSFARFPDLPPQLRIRIWTLFCYMHGRFPKRTICREKLYSGTSKPSGPQI
ncbi:hypothetical protein BofuT4_P138140.1 [Botrytis cinerea T4]|uniref:Uncharacterized protein n=1 Tax=Botryotinia fuckeliana (strain T4) TaxID=999810 RepID=G2YMP2_BOTF4|nr:hypothetical protein BofuT4_P138140.1 [Botrytis cinerea T4]